MTHPKLKLPNKHLPKTPKQASMLWRLEVKYSAAAPLDWYNSNITRGDASEIIESFIAWEKEKDNACHISLVNFKMQAFNPSFQLNTSTPTNPVPTEPPQPPQPPKEVTRQVTLTPDMDIDTVIETLFPVTKNPAHIKDLFDAKQPTLPKIETSLEYFKPPNFDTILASLKTKSINVLVYGPAGSGKSLMGKELAKQMDLEFFCFSCSGGMRYSHVFGGDELYFDEETQTQQTRFAMSPLMLALQRPCLVLIDEIFSLAPDLLNGLNGLLEGNTRTIETKGGIVELHKDARVFSAANTDGRNANRNYTGANRSDASGLDRFVTFKITYSNEVETCILAKLPKLHRDKVQQWITDLRKNIRAANISFDVSTRRLNTCCTLINQSGLDPAVAFQASFLGQLSDTELKKVEMDNFVEKNTIVIVDGD